MKCCCTNNYYLGCFGHCEDITIPFNTEEGIKYTLLIESNGAKIKKIVYSGDGFISIPSGLVNENSTSVLSIFDENIEQLEFDIEGKLFDCLTFKTELVIDSNVKKTPSIDPDECCGIEEAPKDGKSYVRKDGSWIIMPINPSSSSKSLLTISGSVTIDWFDGFATDTSGAPTLSTWSEKYGDLPTIQCWINLGSGVYVLNDLPITHDTVNGTLTIDASGTTNTKIIIS